MSSSKVHRLVPDQVLTVNDDIQIKHLGYSHRRSNSGGQSFFEIEVTGPREFARSQVTRVPSNFKGESTVDFGAIRLVFTKCEDSGPPHRKEAGVEFRIETVRALPSGAKIELKLDQSVFVANELGLFLKSFGHDDDDDGGNTIAEVVLNNGKYNHIQSIFHRPKMGEMIEWQNWEITVVAWNNPGPPHGEDQSLELVVKRK